jgi:hypothetical protein
MTGGTDTLKEERWHQRGRSERRKETNAKTRDTLYIIAEAARFEAARACTKVETTTLATIQCSSQTSPPPRSGGGWPRPLRLNIS